jgi:hypothetical protein
VTSGNSTSTLKLRKRRACQIACFVELSLSWLPPPSISRISMALGTLLIALAFVVVAAAAWRRRDGRRLPPGPKRWPLLGNFFSFPRRQIYDTFNRWQEEYGESTLFTSFFTIRTSTQGLQVMWCTSASSGGLFALSIRERTQKSS